MSAEGVTHILDRANQAVSRYDYETGLAEYNKIYELYKKGNRDPEICIGLLNGGNCNLMLNNYANAFKFYTLALEESEKAHNNRVWNACMSNFGILYLQMNNYPRASHYYELVMNKAIAEKDAVNAAVAISNLLLVSCKSKDTKKAEYYLFLNSKYPLRSAAENKYYRSYAVGMLENYAKNYDLALFYLGKAHETVELHRLDSSLNADICKEEADIYRKTRQYGKAIHSLNDAIKFSKDKDPGLTAECYKSLSETFSEAGRAAEAANYRKIYIEALDSSSQWQDYVIASDEVNKYEQRLNDMKINSLETMVNTRTMLLVVLIVVIVSIMVILTIIVRYNKRLRASYKLLILNNKEISYQNEQNKAQLQELLALKELNKKNHPEDAVTQAGGCPIEIDHEQKLVLLNRINAIMGDLSVISDPDFNLNELSRLANSNSRYLSLVIKDAYNKTFKALLTECRVREACRRLMDEEHYGNYTISAIAESVGYKAQSSLVLAFKKTLGMTPSEYKREGRNLADED